MSDEKLKRDQGGKFSIVDNPGSKAAGSPKPKKPHAGVIKSVKPKGTESIYTLDSGYQWIAKANKYKVGDKVKVVPGLRGSVKVTKV